MIRMCSMCHRELGKVPVPRDPGPENITHGLCAPCANITLSRLNFYWSNDESAYVVAVPEGKSGNGIGRAYLVDSSAGLQEIEWEDVKDEDLEEIDYGDLPIGAIPALHHIAEIAVKEQGW